MIAIIKAIDLSSMCISDALSGCELCMIELYDVRYDQLTLEINNWLNAPDRIFVGYKPDAAER